MAKESLIRKKALQILEEKKWIYWYPKKVKFQETDIFGIADLICCQKNKIRLIQLTTLSNISYKRRKIIAFFKKNRVQLPIEIWAWNSSKKIFKKEKVKTK